LLSLVPKSGTFVEIGTWCGGTAARIAQQRPDTTILCVDPFLTPDHLQAWLLNRRPNMRLFLGCSLEFFRLAGTGVFQCIFIDGDHRKAGAFQDLRDASRAVSPGAPILVHDYDNKAFPEVTEAVDDFTAQTAWRLTQRVNELAVLELNPREVPHA